MNKDTNLFGVEGNDGQDFPDKGKDLDFNLTVLWKILEENVLIEIQVDISAFSMASLLDHIFQDLFVITD